MRTKTSNLRKRAEEIFDAIRTHGSCIGPACDDNVRSIESALLSLQEETRREEREATLKEVAPVVYQIWWNGYQTKDHEAIMEKVNEEALQKEIYRKILSLLDKAPLGGKEK